MEKPRPAKPSDPAHLTLEAWSQGMMVGTLVFMIMMTIANMRRKVLLHKLILIEVRRLALPLHVRLINTRYIIAHHRRSQWFLHLFRTSTLRLVSLIDSNWHDHLVEFT